MAHFHPPFVTEKPPQNHSQSIPSFPSPEQNQEQEKEIKKKERDPENKVDKSVAVLLVKSCLFLCS